ncbi:MAG: hypothetical protein EOP16_02785, partial [Pseudonocardia sp.]
RVTDDGFLLNGQKIWMTLGPSADYALVLARTGTTESRHRRLTMLWVDLATDGVTVRPIVAANGREEFAEVFFENVHVPAEYRVGPQDGGWGVAMFLLQYERGMYAWLRQSILHHRLATVAGRVRPGDTRSSRAVGEAYVLLAALRARSATTVDALAAGRNPGPAVSIDKMLLSSAERATFDAARQVQFEEFVVSDDHDSKTLRDEWFYSRATSIFGGAVDVQRDIVLDGRAAPTGHPHRARTAAGRPRGRRPRDQPTQGRSIPGVYRRGRGARTFRRRDHHASERARSGPGPAHRDRHRAAEFLHAGGRSAVGTRRGAGHACSRVRADRSRRACPGPDCRARQRAHTVRKGDRHLPGGPTSAGRRDHGRGGREGRPRIDPRLR